LWQSHLFQHVLGVKYEANGNVFASIAQFALIFSLPASHGVTTLEVAYAKKMEVLTI
jgi:hypothetical protein